MTRSLHRSNRWPGRHTLRGRLALRVWMVVAVLAAMLGPSARSRPTSEPAAQVAERSLRASPSAPASPGELPREELLLRGEGEGGAEGEAKDANDVEDSERRRGPRSVVWLAPELDAHVVAAVAPHRYGVATSVRTSSAHRSQLHNRGPPVA